MKIILMFSMLGASLICAVLINNKATDSNVAEVRQPARAAEAKAVPVLVELFTSEGCSSCPPADEALTRLEQTQPVGGAQIIALGQHVDYWNRLGWTDPFSSAMFSQRQSDYARAFGKDGVYTPQMIVDGQKEFPGGNMNLARRAIDEATKTSKASVELTRTDTAQAAKTDAVPLQVRVGNMPAISAGDTAEVMLAITESNLRTDVPRGENAGRRLRHASVVRQLRPLGIFDPQQGKTFAAAPIINIGKGVKREQLHAVVFVQERLSRRVLGAAMIALTSST
ncbi:MAG: DUF1223 domain-containing protein [Pyrinomonadaceae bacterium]